MHPTLRKHAAHAYIRNNTPHIHRETHPRYQDAGRAHLSAGAFGAQKLLKMITVENFDRTFPPFEGGMAVTKGEHY